MKNKKMIALLMTAILCLTLAVGCSSENTENPGRENPGTENSGTENSGTENPGTENPDAPVSEFVGPSLGSFTTQDINGNTFTQDIFKENELTMVNIFTTWCTPCVEEMPELEKLYQQVGEKNVGVVGVVLDVLNEKAEIVPDNLKRAQELVEKTGVTYPVLLPDKGYMNGRLTGIEAFPETFFVDKDGNVVGESYSGSGDLEDWLEVVEQELAALK